MRGDLMTLLDTAGFTRAEFADRFSMHLMMYRDAAARSDPRYARRWTDPVLQSNWESTISRTRELEEKLCRSISCRVLIRIRV